LEIHVLDPLSDNRWDELVSHHPRASIFHERGWLEALARTYGYKPFVLTSAPPGEPLENGLVLCRVSSWMTGTRLVSLPFSDHCEPLLNTACELQEFMNWLHEECDRQHGRYVEFRPLSAMQAEGDSLQPSGSYWFHELDLRPSPDQIFRRLHPNSFRRKVQRAEREGLSYESGDSEKLLHEFYRLLLITRKRHHLLPQPLVWFQNLLQYMRKKLQIRVARKNDIPVAAMLTLRHESSVVYKYGCSDERFHSFGGMPFLFWKLLQESKASRAERIDFGRTDLRNEGLLAFKDRLGTNRKLLTYYRYQKTTRRGVATLANLQAVRQFLSFLPEVVSSAAGRVLYRHMG
jgi:hypothetical protein